MALNFRSPICLVGSGSMFGSFVNTAAYSLSGASSNVGFRHSRRYSEWRIIVYNPVLRGASEMVAAGSLLEGVED